MEKWPSSRYENRSASRYKGGELRKYVEKMKKEQKKLNARPAKVSYNSSSLSGQ